jgi:hypothetical protein
LNAVSWNWRFTKGGQVGLFGYPKTLIRLKLNKLTLNRKMETPRPRTDPKDMHRERRDRNNGGAKTNPSKDSQVCAIISKHPITTHQKHEQVQNP